ncbi:helix-turn-helix domain-containing protein [Cohnella hashimotonis]
MDSIGARIKYVRKLHELNQVAFTQAIGISQGTLSELESNKFHPSVE